MTQFTLCNFFFSNCDMAVKTLLGYPVLQILPPSWTIFLARTDCGKYRIDKRKQKKNKPQMFQLLILQ